MEFRMSTLLQSNNLLTAKKPVVVRGTYYVQTWGCQMNEEDSEQLGLYLQQIGYRPASTLLEAQVVLLNTCSVRKKPEDKAFSLLGELDILKRNRPDLIVGVCGCMAQIRSDEIRRRSPAVDFVLGTGQLELVKSLVEEASQRRKFQSRTQLPQRKGAIVEEVPIRASERLPKLKAFIPIQYGCDKFCSFCIVPTTRGRERSRASHDIVAEVESLVANGTREVTLLGQTVNSYGKNMPEGKLPFSALLNRLSEIPQLARIRYTSPYPRDFKSDLIACIRDNDKVMEHCHMPLQAGHDDLLQRMKRQYTVEGFLKIVRELREAVPHLGLTTDVIVGFPGETDEEFEGTLEVIRKVRFDGGFMFAYSPRPGTPAAELEQLPQNIKKERLQRLIDLQRVITLEINESLVGQVFEVLVEGLSPKNPRLLQGYSREFRMMHFAGGEQRIGRLAQVRATKAHPWGLSGELV
jgi:tRNA-2-methylthio-N6-dimethylallyladenosine synthase